MTRPISDLSKAEVESVLSYSPETGEFNWLRKAGSSRADLAWNGQRAGRVAGCISGSGYNTIGVCGRLYQAHRLAWLCVYGRWPVGDIDHINGDRADNRISNLREATRSQNNCNRGATSANTSGYKGVFFKKHGSRWQAQIKINGRIKHIGYFPTPEAASVAYTEAALRLHGEFARVTDVKVATQEPIS